MDQNNNLSSVVLEFSKYFNSLSESDQFKAGKIFLDSTGGKLSPFNSPSPVVVLVIECEDEQGDVKLLGLRRAIQPFIGGLALPGGFVDKFESSSIAASREVLEETGLVLDDSKWLPINPPEATQSNNLLIFLKYKDVLNHSDFKNCKLNSEVQSFELVGRQSELCFPMHQNVVDVFFKDLRSITKTQLKY